MMSRLFLKLLEKCGRKWAIVDFFGDVVQWRYYLFYTESHVDNRWVARLPNLFLHIYPGEESGNWVQPDGESAHSHPYNTWALVLRGGYTENINETYVRDTGRFGIARMSHKDTHRLAKVKPGTVSLFFHGFRVSKWLSHTYVCESVCNRCRTTNNGVCHKTREIKPLDNAIEDTRRNLGGKSWRTIKFVRVDADFETKLANRKEAVTKLKLPELNGMLDKQDFMKMSLINAKQKQGVT